MAATVTISYPIDAKFNEEYYFKTHMPLVDKYFKKHGLKSWFAIKLEAPSPYGIQVTMYWDDIEHWKEATATKEGQEVVGDVPNFSDKGPVIAYGKSIGSNPSV